MGGSTRKYPEQYILYLNEYAIELDKTSSIYSGKKVRNYGGLLHKRPPNLEPQNNETKNIKTFRTGKIGIQVKSPKGFGSQFKLPGYQDLWN